MAIADRVRQLRVERRWSQGELGEKIGVHQKQVSAYERGVNIPSTEVLIKLAEVFNVSLDYLAFEAKGQPAKIQIQDRELLRRFEALDSLPEQDKNLAKEVLDLLILKNRFRELAGSTSTP
jgi:transcriptional regulator with XRE-family HTH domain